MPSKKESGQGFVEYLLILVLVAMVVIAVLFFFDIFIDGVGSRFPDLPYSDQDYPIMSYVPERTWLRARILVWADPDGGGVFQVYEAHPQTPVVCIDDEEEWVVRHDPASKLPIFLVSGPPVCPLLLSPD